MNDQLAVFTATDGSQFELQAGYRQRLWPMDWDEMLKNRQAPSATMVERTRALSNGRRQAQEISDYLERFGIAIKDKDLLEVGCFNGGACFAFAELAAGSVTGVDVPANFVTTPRVSDADIAYWSDYLQRYRGHVGQAFDRDSAQPRSARVAFRDQDVNALDDDRAFDLAVSWDTLEHILDPLTAFQAMYRALRPGGYVCHRYHPFFCESGAHFDTLDFPWGHAQLGPDDVERYIRQVRPKEIEIAHYRFNRTMNRMTLATLQQAVRAAGFSIQALEPRPDRDKRVSTATVERCRGLYPTLTADDLLCSCVWLLARKPA